MAELLLAIDGGTESMRAAVFDLEGSMLGDCAAPYATSFPQPNHAEQDPADWWAAAGPACSGALKAAGASKDDVIALCADTTCCTVVLASKDGRALRPCLLWMDVRASKEADEVAATGDAALCVNSNGAGPVSAEWMIPKSLWLKRHAPEFAEAEVVCEYQDWLNYQLTGKWTASRNNVAVRWHQSGGMPSSLLDKAGIPELAELWPAEVLAPGAVAGELTVAAAEHTGLKEGTPVVQGGADAFIGMIGLGAAQPGDIALITGSSHLQLMVADQAFNGAGVWGTYADAVYPGRQILEGGQTSTGSVINWFKQNFAPDIDYAELNAAAAAIAPGCDGLLSQDHFQGNRTPYTDPRSTGALVGMSLAHGRAHVYRAIIEGVCLGTKLVIDSFAAARAPGRVIIAGGATNSDLWMQIHADTLGLAIERTKVAAAPLLGCAILAATGAGKFKDIDAGIAAMVHAAEVGPVKPDAAAAAAYADVYKRYRELYPALKPFSIK